MTDLVLVRLEHQMGKVNHFTLILIVSDTPVTETEINNTLSSNVGRNLCLNKTQLLSIIQPCYSGTSLPPHFIYLFNYDIFIK